MQLPDQKRAQLAGSVGAGVIGLGLGGLLGPWTAPVGALLFAVGVLLHGWGMLAQRRLEAGIATPVWSQALYWLCWLGLAMLLLWIGIAAWKA